MQMEKERSRLIQPNALHVVARGLISHLLRWPILPAEVKVMNNSIEKAKKLIADHTLWIIGTHPSDREGLEFMSRSIQLIPGILEKSILVPISQHQYDNNEALIKLAGEVTAVTFAPVVNPDARKHGLQASPESLFRYAQLAKESDEKKGVLGLFLQAGRKTSLSLDQSQGVLRMLIAKNRIRKDAKIALMFVSLGPKEKADYDRIIDSYNLGKTWGVTFVATHTLSELYNLLDKVNAKLAEFPIREKSKITIDELGFIILSIGSNRRYTKIDPRYEEVVYNLLVRA